MTEHPAPWWFRLAQRVVPGRCREIPEAVNPARIVLRQVALWKRHVYLQQFASGEDPAWMHSHQWRRTFAIGLWGDYLEYRAEPSLMRYFEPGGTCLAWMVCGRLRRAPYVYTMDADVVHQVLVPSAGHTSLFIGLWRNDDLKHYFRAQSFYGPQAVPWEDHIEVMVKRI